MEQLRYKAQVMSRVLVDNAADGNCMFDAIAHQLRKTKMHPTAAQVRAMAVDNLRQMPYVVSNISLASYHYNHLSMLCDLYPSLGSVHSHRALLRNTAFRCIFGRRCRRSGVGRPFDVAWSCQSAWQTDFGGLGARPKHHGGEGPSCKDYCGRTRRGAALCLFGFGGSGSSRSWKCSITSITSTRCDVSYMYPAIVSCYFLVLYTIIYIYI